MSKTLRRKPRSKARPVAPRPTSATRMHPTSPFRKGPVLLATDGTEQSDALLIAARIVATRLGVAFEVVTVIEPLPIYTGSGDDELPMFMEEDRRSTREGRVRNYVETLTSPRESWRLHVRYGSVAHEIAGVARERAASLVVVGAAPHRRFGFTVAGARAAQLLPNVDCPVLSAAPDFTGLPVHAVAAIDFGPPSIRATNAVVELLESGATLTLIHVVRVLDPDPATSKALTERARLSATASLGHLRAALASRAAAGVTIDARIVEDGVIEGVIEWARTRGVGLVAVGTHGPSVLQRLFVGCTAAGILHAAECSVLACPPPAAADRLQLQLEAADTVTMPRRDDWAALLTEVSTHNAKRTASLEIDDPDIGAQIQGAGLQFMGATSDPHDGRVELMLASGQHRTQHLTRTISGVESVALYRGPDGRDRALEVRQKHGATILTFAPGD